MLALLDPLQVLLQYFSPVKRYLLLILNFLPRICLIVLYALSVVFPLNWIPFTLAALLILQDFLLVVFQKPINFREIGPWHALIAVDSSFDKFPFLRGRKIQLPITIVIWVGQTISQILKILRDTDGTEQIFSLKVIELYQVDLFTFFLEKWWFAKFLGTGPFRWILLKHYGNDLG